MPRAEGTSEHVVGPTLAWGRGRAPLQKWSLHSELEGESELVGGWGTGRGNSVQEGREVGAGGGDRESCPLGPNPSVSRCGLVWREGLYREDPAGVRSWGWALVQCERCPYKRT